MSTIYSTVQNYEIIKFICCVQTSNSVFLCMLQVMKSDVQCVVYVWICLQCMHYEYIDSACTMNMLIVCAMNV